MEYKSNDATPLRPQGDRLINAPIMEMDLNKFISQIKSEVTWKDSNHNSITIFKSDTLRIVLIGMHENTVLKEHSTNAIISVQVLEGKVQFFANDENYSLSKGNMIALQPKIAHIVKAETESFFLLTIAAFEK